MRGTRLGAGLVLVLAVLVATPLSATPVLAASAAEINRDAEAAVARLVAAVPSARELAQKAKAVLVFPSIVKAGFMFGAQYGDGALRRQGKTVGYYNTVAASYGLQAGVQSFGYALLFMNDAALAQLDKTGGFELGVGPQHRDPGRGEGQGRHDHHRSRGHLRVHLRPEGPDGGHGVAGFEDQQDRALSPSRARPAARAARAGRPGAAPSVHDLELVPHVLYPATGRRAGSRAAGQDPGRTGPESGRRSPWRAWRRCW